MDYRIEELAAQPYVFIRTETKQQEIGDRIGEALGRLMPHAGDRVVGAPFARWSKWEGDVGEMEVGVPVREAVAGDGGIQAGELPAGPAAVVTHTGPYDGLAATWQALRAKLAEDGREGRADPWEHYVDDCSVVPAEKVRTIIYWPVA